MKRENYFWAGILTGFLFIKIQFLIIIPFLFIISKDKKNYLIGLLVSFLGMFFINSAIYGINFLSEYLRFILKSENLDLGTDIKQNYSITSILETLNLATPINIVLFSKILMAIALYLLIKNRHRINLEMQISAIFILTKTLTIHTMPSDLVIFLLPIYFLYSLELKKEVKIHHS